MFSSFSSPPSLSTRTSTCPFRILISRQRIHLPFSLSLPLSQLQSRSRLRSLRSSDSVSSDQKRDIDGFQYEHLVEVQQEEQSRFVPVKAFFLSIAIDLKGLQASNAKNVVPPNSRVTNYVVLRFPGVRDGLNGLETGFSNESYCCYMMVFQYGSVILFNVSDSEIDQYLNITKIHASLVLSDIRKDEYAVVEKPTLETWMQGGLDYVTLKNLSIDGIRTIGSILGQSIALDHYIRQVDGMVAEFTDINRDMEKTGTFTMKRKKLFQLVGKANSNLADVILKLGLLERYSTCYQVLIVTVLGILPIGAKSLSNKACRLSLLGTACSSVYSLYNIYGKPRAWNMPAIQVYFQSIVAAKDFMYFVYCLVFVPFHVIFKFSMLPLLCRALEHDAKFLRCNFSHSSLYRRYFEEICLWVEANTTTLNIFSSSAEIALGFILILSIISWQRNILLTFIYWHLIKLMYHAPATASYHRSVWVKISRTVMPYVYRYAPFFIPPLSAFQRWWLH